MSIRYKLLILLLFISLVPLLCVGAVVRNDLTRLGDDLATRSENVLIHKASTGLTRIVKDRAQVLGRERQLLESAALFLASKIEGVLYGHSHVGVSGILSPSGEQIRRMAEQYYFQRMGRTESLGVDFQKLTVVPVDAESDVNDKLLPLLEQVKLESPGLILWIEVRLPDGVTIAYPGVSKDSRAMMPMRMGMGMRRFVMEDIDATLSQSLQWASPRIDSRTGRSAFRISAPVRDIHGNVEGEVSFVIPVDSLLGGEHQTRIFSHETKSFLVKADFSTDHADRIRVIAQEQASEVMGRHWTLPEETARLISDDQEQYDNAVDSLRKQEPMTVAMPYDGREALWSFAPVDADGTALMLIVPREDVIKDALSSKEYVLSQVGRHNAKMVIFALSVCVTVLVLALLLSRLFTRNIAALASAFRKVAKGNFSTRVEVRSTDEIGQLGQAFNGMVPELQERVALKSSLEVAQQVQQSLLPLSAPVFPGADISAISEYCDETGGDYYGFIPRVTADGEGLVVAVGDVSGHGVPAALMMSSARAYLHCQAGSDARLDRIVESVNALMFEDMDLSGRFMTLFLMELTEDKALRWVRAGHDPALLYDPAKDSFVELAGEGMPLGVIDEVHFELCEIEHLNSGTIIAVGTDGIWETHSSSGEMFGKQRLRDILRDHSDHSANEIIQTLMYALDEFRGDAQKLDDITITIMKVL
ncbi:SpoIIE family protein phosphatase [Pseudodesulfovibrio cashew]|uniref:SpoIIE family protein phosphatase n=1 Tax=Pseudodesulfovibrio cashew TaxID=2678688 RepID=A0A6I6JGY8_9BACT|nr:SpoIIE family protein phosphatase [Pseudodesulfovibrio cashew]QGY41441.1 SpoIIE family protein phosphatase [Pseudodesulfovibrio cashew]